ncbi:efflux RND transporter permease subunit [Methylobacter sp. G7]|uniref:efflux RND transporter permease subunit n=1 Tax=Methylobacter sp. G7 TaxID=3230117 RepID=UPI003D808497
MGGVHPIALLPEGKSLGLTAQNVARQVHNAFYGEEVLRQQRGRNEIKIMVRLPEGERILETHIEDLLIWTTGSASIPAREIPLREVVHIKRGRAYLLMGYDLSIISLLGIVALSGIVINDSLILIDHASHLKRHTSHLAAEIIKMAAIQRFRPIVLTTLTTFGGLMPMILETSRQARILIPMVIPIGFGILFATVITLILIPCLYVAADDLTQFLIKKKTKQ